MSPDPAAAQPHSAQPGVDGASAAELMALVPQLDDVGANTADRYEWQAAMAADGLALYLDALGDDGLNRPGVS